MQIKTTIRYYLTPVRMATINKSENKSWQGCGERGNFCTLVEMQMGVASVESSMEISQKLKVDLPFDL